MLVVIVWCVVLFIRMNVLVVGLLLYVLYMIGFCRLILIVLILLSVICLWLVLCDSVCMLSMCFIFDMCVNMVVVVCLSMYLWVGFSLCLLN